MTRDKLLDAAEQLFAEKGFTGASLRAITSRAGVNLAAINYHFRSKEALLRAVFERRVAPINRERLEMLAALEAESGGASVPVEKLIDAVARPVLRLRKDLQSNGFLRIMGRMYVEPTGPVGAIFRDSFGEVMGRFLAAFRRSLGGLPDEEFFWRVHFMIGVMSHVMAGTFHLQFVSNGRCDPFDVDGTMTRLICFVSAGLKTGINECHPNTGSSAS